ncbi:MAG: helix-turn-helix domain-containing protein [Muribaculaceae bacterium]|nr:helix-turn-helix domain-containing protein [Muribaculaceae bacterium]
MAKLWTLLLMFKKQLYAILILMLASITMRGANAYNINQHNQWVKASTEELMRRGQDYLQNKGWTDSAMVCYTIVANRARHADLDSKEMYQIARALNNIGYIYAAYYYDYQKAYENVKRSMEMSRQYGFDNNLAYAYLNMASIIDNRNRLYAAEAFSSDALDNTRLAFDVAVKAREWNVAVTSIYNMLDMMSNKSDFKLIELDLVRFKSLQLTDSVEMWQCTRVFCKATEAYFSGQYATALEYYNQMEAKAQDVTTNRQQCIIKAMQQKAMVLAAMHRYQEAIDCLQQVAAITVKHGMQSELIDTYHALAQVYTALGNSQKADQYDYKYLKAKDELIHKSHAEKLEKSRFLDEMRRVNEQVEEIQAKHERTHQLLLMMSLIAAIILIALVLLVRSNIKQRNYIRHLYEKNVQLLDVKVADPPLASQPIDEQEESAPKYQGLLDQESKDRLFDQIKRVMDDMSIICKPDFSLQQLADQVGSNYKYVSQVLNECYGKSFKQVLNEQRVREACRMFNDAERYGNLTIEAIAANLGFNSRSNFTVTFKRITGISPSDFMKMAKGK